MCVYRCLCRRVQVVGRKDLLVVCLPRASGSLCSHPSPPQSAHRRRSIHISVVLVMIDVCLDKKAGRVFQDGNTARAKMQNRGGV